VRGLRETGAAATAARAESGWGFKAESVPEPQPERAVPESEALPAPEPALGPSEPDTHASSSSLPSAPTPAASGWGSFLEGAADPAPSEPKMSSEEKRAERLRIVRERARGKREVALMLTQKARERSRMAGNAAPGRVREAAGGDASSAATPRRRDGEVRQGGAGLGPGTGEGRRRWIFARTPSPPSPGYTTSYKKNWAGAGPTG
jgi:hypothetical protein